MPELPEVETIRRDLTRHILNKKIKSIEIFDSRVLRQTPQEFTRRLKGRSIAAVIRRGKALVLKLSSGEHLVVQVMMTGQLVCDDRRESPVRGDKPRVKHTRVVFKFSDGTELLYNDQRVFGQMRVVKDPQEIKYFQIIGPEPFERVFSEEYIRGRFKNSKRPIKNTLLDHTFVAGIGNIYACEILFRCGISPKRLAGRIKKQEIPRLREKIVDVLSEAIKHRGSSMRNYRDGEGQEGEFKKLIRVYAREGQSCIVCKTDIKRLIKAGRSTFYCMKCQH